MGKSLEFILIVSLSVTFPGCLPICFQTTNPMLTDSEGSIEKELVGDWTLSAYAPGDTDSEEQIATWRFVRVPMESFNEFQLRGSLIEALAEGLYDDYTVKSFEEKHLPDPIDFRTNRIGDLVVLEARISAANGDEWEELTNQEAKGYYAFLLKEDGDDFLCYPFLNYAARIVQDDKWKTDFSLMTGQRHIEAESDKLRSFVQKHGESAFVPDAETLDTALCFRLRRLNVEKKEGK